MLEIINLSLHRGSKPLLTDASARINPGSRVGLIGPNGCGKSTFLQLLLGKLDIDSGTLTLPDHWRISHMAQETPGVSRTALEYVIDGDHALRHIELAIESAQHNADDTRLAELYAQYEHHQGYSAAARAAQLMAGLGFSEADSQRPVSSFSGGWRVRLNLAQALMCPADLLLLDEPTNHLDLDALLWLESWLQRFEGTLLVISHDRDFLDKVVNRIVAFENTQLTTYGGNYSFYEKQRAIKLSQQQSAYKKQQAEIAHIEDFIRRFRAKATKARQAQSRIKALSRMEQIAPAHVDSPFHFTLPCTDKISSPLVHLEKISLGYSDTSILQNASLDVLPGSRIGLLGPNGAGKSTLIKYLANSPEVQQIKGERVDGDNLSIGYFAQHTLEALDSKASPLLHLQRLSPDAREQQLRDFLGGFGFRGDDVDAAIGHFSGGEKARLALAILAWQKPNLLLLDEPTNHLDLDMRHALTLALQDYPGAVVLVSHDRHLLRLCVDKLLLVANHRVETFEGDLEDYEKWLIDHRRRPEPVSSDVDSEISTPRADKKALRQQAAAAREKRRPLSNQLKKLEKAMDNLQQQLEELEQQLADPELYNGNNDALKPLLMTQGQVRQQLDDTETQWLEISEQLRDLDN